MHVHWGSAEIHPDVPAITRGTFAAPDRCESKVRSAVQNDEKYYTAPPVVRELIGSLDELKDGPQAFVVEVFPAESRFGAHFHAVDQFQVFFGAPGAWYQRSAVDQMLIHYTDAYTTYGPFGTGGSVMSFLTLRPSASELTAFMPGSRDKLIRRGRRNLHVAPGAPAEDLLKLGGTTVTDLIAPEADGLRIARVTIAAGDNPPDIVTMADAALGSCGGQYLFVLDGSFVSETIEYGKNSIGWIEPDTRLAGLTCGDQGVDLVVMRFAIQGNDSSGAGLASAAVARQTI